MIGEQPTGSGAKSSAVLAHEGNGFAFDLDPKDLITLARPAPRAASAHCSCIGRRVTGWKWRYAFARLSDRLLLSLRYRETELSTGIFISYRRSDTRQAAGRLTDDLAQRLPAVAVFRDVDSIDPGLNFVNALDGALTSCAVMLVLIGPGWLGERGSSRDKRIFDPGDWIRTEVATALERGIRVIPVLIDGAPLPEVSALPQELHSLVQRQAFELSDARWKSDLQRLVQVLAKVLRLPPEPAASNAEGGSGRREQGAQVGSSTVLARVGETARVAFATSLAVPELWLHPRRTYQSLLAEPESLERGLAFAGLMFAVSFAAAAALGVPGRLELSAIAYLTLGTVVLWFAYAILMHAFVYLVGGRKGVRSTVAAYLFTIGAVQPLLVLLLATVLLAFPESVTMRDISSFGGSGSGRLMVKGRLLDGDVALLLRAVSGLLIAFYFAPAVAAAQALSLVRASSAVLLSLLFWIAFYAIGALAAGFVGIAPLFRIFGGT
jgi:hypothetical protein